MTTPRHGTCLSADRQWSWADAEQWLTAQAAAALLKP
jgi:hypothetical protein